MPTYDYRCTECGLEVEVVHGIHGSGPATCGSCAGAMRKALSTPAIHFRGSGWAKKDAQTASQAKSASRASDAKDVAARGTGGETSTSTEPSTANIAQGNTGGGGAEAPAKKAVMGSGAD